jgi:pyridoxine 5-phosphate synthase
LRTSLRTVLNFEAACTAEMLRIAEDLRPHQVTFVPEKREEVTTEGGLDVRAAGPGLAEGVRRLSGAGIRTSLFIDPDVDAVRRSRDIGAAAVELHTGTYSRHPGDSTVVALATAAAEAAALGLAVHAGHGLTTNNVARVASIPEVEELNIGHHIVSRAVIVGMKSAVREMLGAIERARPTQR